MLNDLLPTGEPEATRTIPSAMSASCLMSGTAPTVTACPGPVVDIPAGLLPDEPLSRQVSARAVAERDGG
jgi:hypothetical protein